MDPWRSLSRTWSTWEQPVGYVHPKAPTMSSRLRTKTPTAWKFDLEDRGPWIKDGLESKLPSGHVSRMVLMKIKDWLLSSMDQRTGA